MPEPLEQLEVAILGGGPGGYVAALEVARRGASVVLVEKENLGGTCLNVGCIPTKVLTTSAELLSRARRGAEFGLSIPQADVDLPGLMACKEKTVEQLVAGVEQLLRARRVRIVRGTGRLARPGLLDVELGGGRRESIAARHVVLAPGSVAARPPIEGLDLPGVVFSTGALQIDRVPERFAVIGGGVIGMEFACIYEALGSRVTVLEAARTILPAGVDETIAQRLQSLLRRRGIDIRVGIDVKAIEATSDGLRVLTQGPDGALVVEADRVLVATGRWPNTDNLGLEECRLSQSGRFIAVDDRLATSLPGVWSIGDAVGGWMLAHKAMVEGRIVAENLTGGSRRVDHRAVPNVIFTRPEVAGVGLTESDARAAGADVKVTQFAFSANAKSRILGERDGVVRLVCEAGSGRVLGVHMLGPHATDLIAEGSLAVQAGVTADELAWTTHAHPTLPEAMLEAALGFRGAAIHMHSR